MSSPYAFGLSAALAMFVFIVVMLRRHILQEKFAALWIVIAGALVVLAAWPSILAQAAALLGIAVPSNLLLIVAGLVLLAVAVQLSYEVARLDARTQRLAEELALLRADCEARR